jgi:hypothetical protein
MRYLNPITAILAVLIALTGCILIPAEIKPDEATYPPDFALTFHVSAPHGSQDLINKRSRYLLGSDRVLRLAVGAQVDESWLPPAAAELTITEMGRIYELTDYVTYNGQVLDPDWPADQVAYHVTRTRFGQTQITTLTPAKSTELVALLTELVGLSGR